MSRAGDGLKAACITVLGSGHLPLAPGSWGSLAAVVLFVPVWLLAAASGFRPAAEVLVVLGVLLASWLSVLWGPWAIERWRRKDPKQFVLDEFAGQWVALLGLPMVIGAGAWTVCCVLAGQFFWFRLFDVLKPPPARQMERLPAGWGILVDDLFAGAYANVVGQLMWRLTPLAGWLGAELTAGGN